MKKVFLLILVIIIGGDVYYYQTINYISPKNDLVIPFEIKAGESSLQIGQNLKKLGLIKNVWVFELYSLLNGVSNHFLVGKYNLDGQKNLKEYVAALTSNPRDREISITIIEGWDNEQISQYLEEKGIIKKRDFLKITDRDYLIFQESYDFLIDKPNENGLIGYLFPDTYRIYKDTSAEEIIKKMLVNFGRKLNFGLREQLAGQGKSIFETVILASILEKEVQSDWDKRTVADIFYRRIAKGMPMQADSTINFITKKGRSRASAEDIKINNPYNTYKYKGLPPGPIANPGLIAIKAAIIPLKNDYWYFLTTEDGQVIYSKTYQEHLRNKEKYLK